MLELNRRQILKSISLGAGSVLLPPILGQIEAQAAGRNSTPKRFVFVLEGNGLNPDQIQPTGIDRSRRKHERTQLRELPLTDAQLPTALEPLNDLKDKVTIIQGLSGRVCGGGHSNNFGALGVYSSKQGPAGETIDVALAKNNPGVFTHVGLGISDRPEHSMIYNCSAWDTGKALPTQCRPDLAYNALFGSVAKGSGRHSFNTDKNLLDFMRDDVRRAQNQLRGQEKEQFDNYLEAFESMRNRQTRLAEMRDSLQQHAPQKNNKFTSQVETERLEAQFELAAASLITGLTNTATIASGVGDPYFSVKFRGLGIQVGKHTIGHGRGSEGKTWRELAIIIRRFHINLVAQLAKKLQAMPEGNGTMLDNTCIVYMSDAAEGHHSRCWEWPFVLIGGLGGRLQTNRYIEYPYYGNRNHKTIANLYTTFLHAAGVDRKFGQSDPGLRDLDTEGPLSELLVA